MGIKRGDDNLADVAGRDRIAGAGPDDFHDQVLIDHHALLRRGLERDQAEIGGAEGLVGVDPARFDFRLQRGRAAAAASSRILRKSGVPL